jgi:hypothetical protein
LDRESFRLRQADKIIFLISLRRMNLFQKPFDYRNKIPAKYTFNSLLFMILPVLNSAWERLVMKNPAGQATGRSARWSARPTRVSALCLPKRSASPWAWRLTRTGMFILTIAVRATFTATSLKADGVTHSLDSPSSGQEKT